MRGPRCIYPIWSFCIYAIDIRVRNECLPILHNALYDSYVIEIAAYLHPPYFSCLTAACNRKDRDVCHVLASVGEMLSGHSSVPGSVAHGLSKEQLCHPNTNISCRSPAPSECNLPSLSVRLQLFCCFRVGQ